jgi:hypothetical protein
VYPKNTHRITLTNSTTNRENDESMSILVPNKFDPWFRRVSNNRILVPDTNALMSRFLSGLQFVLGKQYLQNLMV